MKQSILHWIGLSCLLAMGAGSSFASTPTPASTEPAAPVESTAPASTATPDTSAEPSTSPDASAGTTAASTTTSTSTDSATPVYADTPPTKDPLEKFNRGIFKFNDKLDNWILKPVASFYNLIMPRPLNQGVHNVFTNIGNLPTIANDVLQLHFHQAANDLWRLGINTTVGIGGLFDIADRMQLKPYSNDFGLTLAYWGYENSTYLVVPFFGPCTIRDGIGWPVDYFAFSIYPYIEPPSLRYQIYGLGVVDRRAQLLQYQSVMEEASLDRYAFIRNAYMQRRAYQIEQNKELGTSNGTQGHSTGAPVISSDNNLT